MMPEPITKYRNWVLTSSIGARGLLFLGVVALFMFFGSQPAFITETLPGLLVQFIYLIVLLFLLYSLYALVRSFIPGYGNPDSDG